MSPITVRPATRDDADVLAGFPDADKLGATFEQVDRREALWVVAERDSTVVGAAILDLVSDLKPELKRLWVIPEARREGVGSAMCAILEQDARERGFDEALMAIDPDNERAIPLAIDLGYSATGDHLIVDDPDEVHQDSTGAPLSGANLAIYRKSLRMN